MVLNFLKPGRAAPPIENEAPQPAAEEKPIEQTQKTAWQRRAPVIACGAGLFSDGYLNQVIGPVGTMLGIIYGDRYENSIAQKNISSLAFVGQVIGIAFFGWTSDGFSRKWSLFASTVILLVFAALSAGAYGANDSLSGLFAALSAYRLLTGIGIGGEYPAGSVGCSESTGELQSGVRNRWFIWFTDLMIDIGFVVGAFVPMVVVLATGEDHLRAAWRICLGIGVIPPLSLIYMRYKLEEPEAFRRETMAKTKTPWKIVFKLYWFRLAVVSIIWFLYDFAAYAFTLYLSSIVVVLLGPDTALWKSFGWSTLITLFYVPGSIFGSFLSDWIGPRKCLVVGVWSQCIVGFIMAGVYEFLIEKQNIGGFVVVYGLFLALGEVGPGDNIGLIASKTCATGVRGRYYAVAAAMGKIGAFVGSYAFTSIQNDGSTPVERGQYPFWVAASLAALSGALAFWCLPEIEQDTIDIEDRRFRAFLQENGFDTTKMGLDQGASSDEDEVGSSKVQVEQNEVFNGTSR